MKKPADSAGFLLRGLGKFCLIGAAFVAGYLTWILWGTGLVTAQAQAELRASLTPLLEDQKPPPAEPTPRIKGQGIALLDIPRIDLDEVAVVDGTSTQDLMKGPGLYEDSAMPWEDTGRVMIAGHRTTYQHPFYELDDLRQGDEIILRTEYGTFTYKVTGTRSEAPTPAFAREVTKQTREPTLILSTCDPPYSAERRLIVYADRV